MEGLVEVVAAQEDGVEPLATEDPESFRGESPASSEEAETTEEKHEVAIEEEEASDCP